MNIILIHSNSKDTNSLTSIYAGGQIEYKLFELWNDNIIILRKPKANNTQVFDRCRTIVANVSNSKDMYMYVQMLAYAGGHTLFDQCKYVYNTMTSAQYMHVNTYKNYWQDK